MIISRIYKLKYRFKLDNDYKWQKVVQTFKLNGFERTLSGKSNIQKENG